MFSEVLLHCGRGRDGDITSEDNPSPSEDHSVAGGSKKKKAKSEARHPSCNDSSPSANGTETKFFRDDAFSGSLENMIQRVVQESLGGLLDPGRKVVRKFLDSGDH